LSYDTVRIASNWNHSYSLYEIAASHGDCCEEYSLLSCYNV
jgi:hypothetical protein